MGHWLGEGEFRELVSEVIDGVVSEVNGGKSIVVLVPPGSARGEVLRELTKPGRLNDAEFLVYDELYGRLGINDPRFKPMRGLLVGGRDVIDYIVDGHGSVRDALGSRCIVIVTESTMEALVLIRRLREALGEEWSSLKSRILLRHLSSAFKSVLDDLGVKYPEFIKTHHRLLREDDATKDLIRDTEGISLRLLREWQSGGLSEVELSRGVEAIRALSPGRLGLTDLARDFANELPLTAFATLPTSVAYAVGLLFIAPALQAVALASGLAAASGVIGEFIGRLAERLGIDVVKEPLKKFSEKILGIAARRGDARNRFLASMGKLLKAVVEAYEYVNDLRFEGVVDDVALEWGLDIETFRNFINNMHRVATQKLVTEDELNKLRRLSDEEFRKKLEELFNSKWGEFAKEIEERLDRLEEEIEKLRHEVENLIAPLRLPLHFNAESLGVEFRSGDVILSNVLLRDEVTYAHNPLEDAILRELVNRRRGVVVVVGPKGVGKSVAAKVALARLLGTSNYGFVVAEVTGDVDKGELSNSVTNARGLGYEPLFYLDPSKPEHYPTTGGEYEPLNIQLLTIISAFSDVNAPLLVVLSDDQYSLVKQELNSVGAVEVRVGDVLGDKVGFLTGLAMKYGKCSDDASRELAMRVASEFSDNYTVATVLAADWLSKNNCDTGQILKAIKGAKGKINEFIKDYIWYAVLGRDVRERSAYAERLAPLILAIDMLYGPFPRRLAVEYLRAFGKSWDGMDNDPAVLWFTQPMHDTVQRALGEMTDKAVKCAFSNCSYAFIGDNPNYVVYKIAEVIRKIAGTKAKNTKELKNLIFDDIKEKLSSLDWADIRRVIKDDRDKRSLARLIGLAYTPYTPYSVKGLGDNRLVKSLSDWLMVGDEIPLAAMLFLQAKAGSFSDVVSVDDACRFINKIYEKARKMSFKGSEILEVLGILAITKGNLTKCLEKAINLTFFAIDIIGIKFVAPSLLKDGFTGFMKGLLEKGMYDEAAKLLHAILEQNVDVAAAVYKAAIEPKYKLSELVGKLSRACKLLLSKTLFELSNVIGEIEFIKEVIDFNQKVIKDICGEFGNNDVRCLYAKAKLYPLIALNELDLGMLSEAEKHGKEAVNDLEELNKIGWDIVIKGLRDLSDIHCD